jgi:hypothetical protein
MIVDVIIILRPFPPPLGPLGRSKKKRKEEEVIRLHESNRENPDSVVRIEGASHLGVGVSVADASCWISLAPRGCYYERSFETP